MRKYKQKVKKCKSGKVTFTTLKQAQQACTLINREHKIQKLPTLRPYICDYCSNYHLTKLTKAEYRARHDKKYRIRKENKDREFAFIKDEGNHWKKHFNKKNKNKKKSKRFNNKTF